MLSYAFTEEQEDLRAMVREFAHGEIAPLVEEAEREEKFPVQVLPMLGELGLLGIVFPEEYGGIGADKITECIFVEEMAKVCAGITASVNARRPGRLPDLQFGTDAQREPTYPAPSPARSSAPTPSPSPTLARTPPAWPAGPSAATAAT
jgi:alkylation response protein AidB-like acyl-CoA dehydrogenase